MKYHSLILTLILSALVACGPSTPSAPPALVTKTLLLTIAPVEQRMQFSFFSDPAWTPRTVTVYYLVARDGTRVEVPLGEFAQYKPGDEYSAPASSWKSE